MDTRQLQSIADKIKNKVPKEIALVAPLVNGIQARIINGPVLTFYYRSMIYRNNITGASICFQRGQEHNIIKAYVVMPEPEAKPFRAIEVNAGAAACIKHVEDKLRLMGEAGHGAAKAMLKTLITEFQQYL